MNTKEITSYIEEYKKNIDWINSQEIYKWHAIKHFQDNFDINSQDLYSNLEVSLSKASNLLDSGYYYPKRMLLANVQKTPEKIRSLFQYLFNEELDILERIQVFHSELKSLNKENFGYDKNDYQDHRAIIVYLTLNYPERYFLYKFKMFKDFTSTINFPYTPIRGRIENIGQYLNICELIRNEIEKDNELIGIHESRLDKNCYRDKRHNVLTQDFIYAVVRYINKPQILQEKK